MQSLHSSVGPHKISTSHIPTSPCPGNGYRRIYHITREYNAKGNIQVEDGVVERVHGEIVESRMIPLSSRKHHFGNTSTWNSQDALVDSQNYQTFSDASLDVLSVLLLTAASFSTNLCSSALSPLSLREVNTTKRD
jgi:hypothetical protein